MRNLGSRGVAEVFLLVQLHPVCALWAHELPCPQQSSLGSPLASRPRAFPGGFAPLQQWL